MKQLANNLIDSLKAQPLALVLLVVNLTFLVAVYFATARRDALLEKCIDVQHSERKP